MANRPTNSVNKPVPLRPMKPVVYQAEWNFTFMLSCLTAMLFLAGHDHVCSVSKENQEEMCGYVNGYKKLYSCITSSVFDTQVLSFPFIVLYAAEDDNFVVWNMLSDKDGPSMRGEEEEEEEDDYFMDEY